MSGLLRNEYIVYSEKHDIHGVIKDYSMVTKLFFDYKGKEIVMGITRNPLGDKDYEEIGRDLIDSYVDNLASRDTGRKTQLHYWYIVDLEKEGAVYQIGHGIVTGHDKLSDSINMHTSPVQAVQVDEEAGELILITADSIYHCPLEYCRYRKQDNFPDIIPDYEKLKEKYFGTINHPSIEPGNVLLVLSDFCEYYFHSLYYVPADSEDGNPLEYTGWPHVGTFQDSYLIQTDDYKIDLRYFPHYQNIEFYSRVTDGCPLFMENIGDTVLYAKTNVGTIRLDPGDRKEVTKENAEADTPVLPGGDLYPAGIIE